MSQRYKDTRRTDTWHGQLREARLGIEQPIEHRDVTTIMALLGDIKGDVRAIRMWLEDDNGEEEEAPEADG